MSTVESMVRNITAVFDADRRHRFRLDLDIKHPDYGIFHVPTPDRSRIVWLMCNPSIADEKRLDPTLRRCVTYSYKWGYASMTVLNLFSRVDPDPDVLLEPADDQAEASNDAHRLEVVGELQRARKSLLVCAWGNAVYPCIAAKAARVVSELTSHSVPLHTLGLSTLGHPKHPLYLPKTATPVPWGGFSQDTP